MADESDDEWRFSVDEVGEDADDTPAGDGDDEPGTDGPTTDAGIDDRDGVTMVGEDDDGPTVGITTGTDDEDDDEGEDGDGVAGPITSDEPVEPGTPTLENVVFVTLGAIGTTLVFAALLTPLSPVDAATIALGIAAGAALLYGFFRRF